MQQLAGHRIMDESLAFGRVRRARSDVTGGGREAIYTSLHDSGRASLRTSRCPIRLGTSLALPKWRKAVKRAALGAASQQGGRDRGPILMQEGRRQAQQSWSAEPAVGAGRIDRHEAIKRRDRPRPLVARRMPVGLCGSQGGLYTPIG
jgi:hypothetical protein